MILLITLLAVAIVACVLLRDWTTTARRELGLRVGALVAADDSTLSLSTLRSERFGLVCRPDQILRSGRFLIPVEQKPRARRLYPSHVMQVAAQCLLVQEVYGVRPPYGVVVLAEGRSEQVSFTPELESQLLVTISKMREVLITGVHPGPRWMPSKCKHCGYRDVCWQEDAVANRRRG
jgi:CRISPR-associated exonuclease Cas4